MSQRMASEGDIDFIATSYREAFAFTRSQTLDYIGSVGLNSLHVVEVEQRPAAVFALIDAGHWFGGKVVSACNIAHVAICPEHRGSGLAATILDMACAKALEKGALIATLFASTRPVYRRSGFELAGSEIIYEADTSELYKIRDRFQCRRVTGDAILNAIIPIHKNQSSNEAGVLERHATHWNILLGKTADEVSVFVFDGDGDDTGYAVIDTSNPDCLVLRDWAALSGLAARQILKFIGTFSTVYPTVRWHGAPHDALVFAMPDKGWRLVHQEEFLLRVLSPKDALAARGYDCGNARIGIDVVQNGQARSFTLSIGNGIASCEEEASAAVPRIAIGQSQLATLFTGFRTARFLARAGWLTADEEAIKICDRIFTGPFPWVGEHF